MGNFFSKFKNSLDKGVNTVSIKSNTLVEINKVKSNITALKNIIQTKKIEIANIFYNMYLDEAINIEKCIGICEEIKKIEEEIKTKEIEIENIKIKEEGLLAQANKPEEVKTPIIITPNTRPVAEEVSPDDMIQIIEEELIGDTIQAADEILVEDRLSVQEENIEEVSVKICECGVVLQENMKFCVQCGKKIEW